MASLEIKNLRKSYDTKNSSVEAVKGISFTVNKGEMFGFLGPNGAGKTTTINCICQLSMITSGTILVNGFDVENEYLEARTQIGLSPQELQFDPYFPIMDILVYQGGYYGMKKKEATKRAKKLLKEFNIYDKRKAHTKELSGGMKRKFSIIKALMHNPKILILDEPTAGLDVDSRYELWNFIKKLNKKGITIIITTHYIEEAEKLCNRICIVNKGKIIKLDYTHKVIEELSENVITFYLDTNKKMPKEMSKYNYSFHDRKLEIVAGKNEQSKSLREVLEILDKNKINVVNFNVHEENLENIFRRIVNED